MTAATTPDIKEVALRFVRALASRDYATAYAMTGRHFQERTTLKHMQAEFEAILPLDWGPTEPIEVGPTMDQWPTKQESDVGWVYVSIAGDVYSEAVSVVVTEESGELAIRDVEFGRP